MDDLAHLIRDKYASDSSGVTSDDRARLARGEPLAYVISWIPFLGLHIDLSSKPLIPRAETEWWTEELMTHLRARFATLPFTFLDLCAGSGAIGLAVLAAFPAARVFFGELVAAHREQIQTNLEINNLDATRADIRVSDLFTAFSEQRFDIIASNPPYIPSERVLDPSVTDFEPRTALFAGTDGLALIRRIASEAAEHLNPSGELWLECDTEHAEPVQALLASGNARKSEIRTDLYGRPRLLVAHYS